PRSSRSRARRSSKRSPSSCSTPRVPPRAPTSRNTSRPATSRMPPGRITSRASRRATSTCASSRSSAARTRSRRTSSRRTSCGSEGAAMHFTFTEEQQMLEDTVRRFVARDYTFERRRAIAASPEGWSREVWNHFAELGLLGLNVPEEHGGLDAGAVETMLVMNALGRGLVVEPYLASAVLATWLIRLAASETQQRELLPALARGETVATVAQAEPGARYELNRVAARAERTADGYRLRGRKSGVLHGAAADWLIVSARTAGEVADRDGISLFLLRRDTPGLEVRAYPTF